MINFMINFFTFTFRWLIKYKKTQYIFFVYAFQPPEAV